MKFLFSNQFMKGFPSRAITGDSLLLSDQISDDICITLEYSSLFIPVIHGGSFESEVSQ